MSVFEIKHSPAPFTVEVRGKSAFLSTDGRDGGRGVRSDRDTPWLDFAVVVVEMESSDKPNPTGVANLNLFLAAPALLQVAIACVCEHGARGGVYDQLLPVDRQPPLVREAMRAVEAALSRGLP